MVDMPISQARRVRGPITWRRPNATYLYRLFDELGSLLYIGITWRPLAHRFNGHARVKPWWGQVAYVELHEYETRTEALAAEREAIRNESPRFNRRSRVAPEPLGRTS